MTALVRALIPLARNLPTFESAAASYTEHGGEDRYLAKIIAHFADTPLAEITPFDVRQMAIALYPDASGSTRNRCAVTPARAVLSHAYDRGWCPLMRIRRFKSDAPTRKNPASPAWLQIFVRQCDIDRLPHLAALVLFMTMTGARISEAVRLCWNEVDLMSRTAVLLITKTSRNSRRFLPDELADRMRALAGNLANPAARVFRYTSRYSVNERIKAVCFRAGLSYKSPHLCGRHSFATNSLALGSDIRETMEAGDWKSSTIFLEIYVHAKNAGRRVADRFNGIEFDVDL